ncbi:2-oxoacid:acceptor oxidoreductase subunit alpha [Anaerolineales bacterium HSG6]|nr:2-oxoacid:acceptor oxidoreductase subunit alpha [Anaerolineales bacterium HSG6]MDM8533035.1 2-oxoacid:acceptor oxidoreductase subunit alpha [Anaerolineales bacterium HSG25]
MTEPKLVEYEDIESVIIRFAGDSGDGMQLTGTQFTNTSAIFGNDISTLPDYPSEIRAPAGTLAGVSGFQVNLSSADILTPGDEPRVLVAMNPAALKANLPDLQRGGVIIVNEDAFKKNNLRKAEYDTNPLEDDSLVGYRLCEVPLTSLNRVALESIEGLTSKEIDRCQNFFALGLTFWLFDRPLEISMEWLDKKFTKKPHLAKANITAMQAGYSYGHNTETFQMRYRIKAAKLNPGHYRKITGNEALAMGLVTAAQKANKPLFYGAYPITPATDILHHLVNYKNFNVRTLQVEDEIAAMGSTIGAAFGGTFAATGTSGPGLALKSEAINLAVMLELPMVIVNVQRGGPSTGLPTKTEQSDLMQAMFGRNGESPVPIIAPATPSDCFETAIEAFRFAVRSMSPVFVLTDGYLGNSSEPWLIRNPDDIPPIEVSHPTEANSDNGYLPYLRDPETMARPWAIPGTAGLEHRLGGLSKQPETGNVSYDPLDNERMNRDRVAKVAKLVDIIPDQEIIGPDEGDLLVLSWGSTYGAVRSAVQRLQGQGQTISHGHIRYLNPFPANLGDLVDRFKRVAVPEMNLGQLVFLLRGRYGFNHEFIPISKIHGRPFTIGELVEKIGALL